ncbi:MAG: excinuclease ABC subunit UvrB [Anaerofustis stercorihominis]|nr:excinuclease ABC subunit UvrB [Anaerofustis stercorihominis]
MSEFRLVSDYSPTGDQPEAIANLADGINSGKKFQTLLGVTGSGKTFTVANVIEKVNKPTLVLAHNKTLAAQLYSEFKSFFPENAVEYFVSYYDYYQPEAYVPGRDLYIEKDADINDEIEKMRHSATAALSERRDVIVVASVSCIYGLGSPEEYERQVLSLRPGMTKERDEIARKLIDIQYTRDEIDFHRGTFRLRGDIIDIFPASATDTAIRVELFGDEIDRIAEISAVTGQVLRYVKHAAIYPASHYVTSPENMEVAIQTISEELAQRVAQFKEEGKLVEAQRLMQRTNYDLELLREMGYCKGIENYTRHLNRSLPGEPPFTLMDYFDDDYLLIIDESHVSIPQVRGMFGGDRSRKQNLVDYGFRLPSAFDNRPLNFEEFESKLNQVIFTSATPGPYENEHTQNVVQQIVRPTGLLDPKITVVPTEGQIDHLIGELNKIIKKGQKALITTLTKRMAEDLTAYFSKVGLSVAYLHSDVETVERMKIINDLRSGVYDAIIGINLLREGLDIPEVSLVAILDADKEGFLRSETSLIQTIGRAARNIDGHVIMYADTMTGSMQSAIDETNRRRDIQKSYNEKHNITPQGIRKTISSTLETMTIKDEEMKEKRKKTKKEDKFSPISDVEEIIRNLENEMFAAAEDLNFERAAALRDRISNLRKQLDNNG